MEGKFGAPLLNISTLCHGGQVQLLGPQMPLHHSHSGGEFEQSAENFGHYEFDFMHNFGQPMCNGFDGGRVGNISDLSVLGFI